MRRRWVVAGVATLAVLGLLTLLVASKQVFLLDADNAVGLALVVHGAGTPIDVLQVLTAPGAEDVRYPILIPIAGFLLWFRRWRLAAFVSIPALAIAPLTTLIKEAVGRERPSYPGTTVDAGGLSFPSGHSSGAAVLAGVLLVLLWPRTSRRWRPALVAIAVLGAVVIAWTRLALGVHYLSDVVAGLALGAAVVLLAALTLRIPVAPSSAVSADRATSASPAAMPARRPSDDVRRPQHS